MGNYGGAARAEALKTAHLFPQVGEIWGQSLETPCLFNPAPGIAAMVKSGGGSGESLPGGDWGYGKWGLNIKGPTIDMLLDCQLCELGRG